MPICFSKKMHGMMQCLRSSALDSKAWFILENTGGSTPVLTASPAGHREGPDLDAASPWLPAVLGSKAKGNSKAK